MHYVSCRSQLNPSPFQRHLEKAKKTPLWYATNIDTIFTREMGFGSRGLIITNQRGD